MIEGMVMIEWLDGSDPVSTSLPPRYLIALIFPAGILPKTRVFLPDPASMLQQSMVLHGSQCGTEEERERVEHDIVHRGNPSGFLSYERRREAVDGVEYLLGLYVCPAGHCRACDCNRWRAWVITGDAGIAC